MQLDILFVHANASKEIYQELSKDFSARETPIWAGLLANHCRSKGFGVRILDCEAEELTHSQGVDVVKHLKPRVVCFVVYGQQPSASTQNMEGATTMADLVKLHYPEGKILFVGGHVAALPMDTMRLHPSIDFICQNEGVYTISDLLKIDDFEDYLLLERVRGLGWRREGKINLNTINAIVPQDRMEYDLPGLAWDLLPNVSKYRTSGWHSWPNGTQRSPFASLYTSLGCPFKCHPAGTKIIVSNGPNKSIQKVKVGDKLIGYDEKTGKLAETEVVRLFQREHEGYLLKIKFENGHTVKCTDEHPYYVHGKWIEAKDLKVGDEIHTMNFKDKIAFHKRLYNPMYNEKASSRVSATLKESYLSGKLESQFSDPKYREKYFVYNGLKIVEIKKYGLRKPTVVYNFECYPHQNYFVGLSRASKEYILSHNCNFCMINIINRIEQGDHVAADKSATFRYWRPEWIIDEFDKIVKMGVKSVKIADELFCLKEAHFMEICKLIAERKYDLNIWAYSRVDTCKPHHLDALKKAGVNWLALGIESPNQVVRKDVIKGGYKEVKIVDVINMIRNAGINVGANYIFGLPLDTMETMQQTLDFAIDANTENVNFYCFPAGTSIWTPAGLTNIEKLEIGNKVFSSSGVSEVMKTFSREVNEEVCVVKPRLLPSFTCTKEHPVCVAVMQRSKRNKINLTGEFKFVEAKDIVCFDKKNLYKEYHALVIPKKNFVEKETFVDLSCYVKGILGSGRKGGQLNKIGQKYMTPWKVDEEFAEFCGWYVAEGSRGGTKNNQVALCLGAKEPENIERVRYLILNSLGLKSRVIKDKKSDAVQILFTSKVWRRAVHDIFGENACTKKVPQFIMDSTKEIAKAFLKGYLNGDGTSWPNSVGQMVATSASKGLIDQVMMLFIKIGIIPSCGKFYTKEGRIIRNKPIKSSINYSVSWMEKYSHKLYLEDDRNYYLPIRSVEFKNYEGEVHNIETSDGTYCLPYIVHNCAAAYPGSPLHIEARQKGWLLPDRYAGYSQHSWHTQNLPSNYLSAAEILKFRDEAWYKYFTNPSYLNMLEGKFGKEAREDVENSAKIKLKRKLLGDPNPYETH